MNENILLAFEFLKDMCSIANDRVNLFLNDDLVYLDSYYTGRTGWKTLYIDSANQRIVIVDRETDEIIYEEDNMSIKDIVSDVYSSMATFNNNKNIRIIVNEKITLPFMNKLRNKL